MDEQVVSPTHTMHTVEYYAALKGMSCLHTLVTWMSLEDSMLSEISQAHKGTNIASFHLSYEEWKFIETENRMVVSRPPKEGKMELVFHG